MEFLKNTINSYMSREDLFFLLIDKNIIIGSAIIGFNENGWNFNKNIKYAIKSFCIHSNYQGKRLSKNLIQHIFNFFYKNNIKILKQSGYTFSGSKKLKHNFNNISKDYPTINFIDYNY